jgi:hypothetical protein
MAVEGHTPDPGRGAPVSLQFLSLLQNDQIQDMVVLYAAERKIITVLKLGVPVCGHPTLVHGEQPPAAHQCKLQQQRHSCTRLWCPCNS